MEFFEGKGLYCILREVMKEDIVEVINGFVNMVKYVKVVGFDGVEIYGVNGYLFD